MSDCYNYRTLHALRQMAWQRAKGELKAMLETFWEEDEEYEELEEKAETFFMAVEDGQKLCLGDIDGGLGP